jgi:branched-chain amino acid transport system substrate-binding protein
MYHRIRYLILAITLAMAANGCPVYGQQTDRTENEPWVFGMSTALTGPAATLGMDMQNGVLAAFTEVNRAGGIRGHELQLIVLDDGYATPTCGHHGRCLPAVCPFYPVRSRLWL